MTDQVQATFDVTSWDESPFDEGVGVSKLTQAVVAKAYAGGIEGTSHTSWLMSYGPDGTATFVGLERIRGTIAGRHGSLVLQHVGTFANGSADASLSIVSGTDQLEKVSGSGSFKADPAGSVTLTCDFG